jgi:hypothetical protein
MHIILGFPKCGTTSLEAFLKAKYGNDNVTRREWCYMPFEEQLEFFKREFGDPKDHKLYFILRDPEERTLSGLNAWGPNFPHRGETDPVKQTEYHRWMLPWTDYAIVIIHLEDIANNPDFPKLNSLR